MEKRRFIVLDERTLLYTPRNKTDTAESTKTAGCYARLTITCTFTAGVHFSARVPAVETTFRERTFGYVSIMKRRSLGTITIIVVVREGWNDGRAVGERKRCFFSQSIARRLGVDESSENNERKWPGPERDKRESRNGVLVRVRISRFEPNRFTYPRRFLNVWRRPFSSFRYRKYRRAPGGVAAQFVRRFRAHEPASTPTPVPGRDRRGFDSGK